jgi:hypothetical protein
MWQGEDKPVVQWEMGKEIQQGQWEMCGWYLVAH